MASALSQGGEIRTTKLTEHFGFDEFIEKHGQSAAPLFAIDPKGKVHVYCEEQRVDPKPRWSIIYLHTVEGDTKEQLIGRGNNRDGRPAIVI